MNNVIKNSSKGARQGGIGLKYILNEDIFTNVIYYTEFADGKKYVGQTTQGLLKRHNDHINATKPTHYDNILKAHMDEAIIYPICFSVEDIEDVDTVDLLNGLEVAEIMLRESFNDVDSENGLNHTTGGYSHEKSEATKEKIRNIQFERYGYNITIEDIKKMIDEGLTNKEIAERIGCHLGSLHDLLKTRGLPSMKQLRNKGKTHWVENGEYFIKESKNGFSIFGGNNKSSSIINKIKDESKAIELCNALNNGELFPREIIRMKHKGEI